MQKSCKNKIVSPNKYIAQMLLKLYAGKYSATKNLLQFLYFLYYLFPEDGDIYFAIKTIVDDEFLCHKILAEDIVFLGDLPQYKYSQNLLFSVGDIEYPRSVFSVLDVAIEIKENYIIEIKNVLQKVKNKQIACDLCKILQINQRHKQMLFALKNSKK